MRPLPKEPDHDKRKKVKLVKAKVYKPNDKLEISSPPNFEHTVHVGFDPHSGEFTGQNPGPNCCRILTFPSRNRSRILKPC